MGDSVCKGHVCRAEQNHHTACIASGPQSGQLSSLKEKYSQGFVKSVFEQSVVEFHQHL